jgi:hypothetical protein
MAIIGNKNRTPMNSNLAIKSKQKYDSSTQINKSLQMPTLAGYSLLDSYAGPRTFIRSWKTKYPGTHFFAPILFFFTQ